MALPTQNASSKVPTKNRMSLFIFSLICIIAGGAVLFFWGIPTIQNAFASKSWPSVQGVITTSQFITDTDSDGTTYKADIGYEYVVDGQTQNGSKVGFGDYGSSNASHARSIVNKYPPGEKVSVYYNPNQLETAVLEPGVGLGSFLTGGIGLLFFVLGLIMMFQSIKGKPSAS